MKIWLSNILGYEKNMGCNVCLPHVIVERPFGLGGGSGGGPGVNDTNITDLDALTDPQTNSANSNLNANQNINTNSQIDTNSSANTNTQPTTGELTLAECIIYEKLEIEDERGDALLREISCPEYSECLSACELYKNNCFSDITGVFAPKPYSACVVRP